METWRTQGAAPHDTGDWTREKVLVKKAPSLLWGVQGSHLIVQLPGPQCSPHSEIWKGGAFPPWHRTSIFFVLVLVQSHLAPRLYTWPLPTGSGEPSSRGLSYKERLPETLQPPGLNKHFLGVSQPWEEILGLCLFYSWICWASDHCVICPGHSSGQWVRWDLNPDSMSWSPWLYRCFCSSVKFIYFFDAFVYDTVLFSLMVHILLHSWVY